MSKIKAFLNDVKFVNTEFSKFVVWQYDRMSNKQEWFDRYYGISGTGERNG